MGGWPTIYYMAIGGVLGCHFTGFKIMQLIPTREILTRAGALSYFKAAGPKFLLPVAAGYALGMMTFGNPAELLKLNAHRMVYKDEIEKYIRELYYT